jgi:hypothetical protein
LLRGKIAGPPPSSGANIIGYGPVVILASIRAICFTENTLVAALGVTLRTSAVKIPLRARTQTGTAIRMGHLSRRSRKCNYKDEQGNHRRRLLNAKQMRTHSRQLDVLSEQIAAAAEWFQR